LIPKASALQPACDGKRRCHDAFLAKLDKSGRKLLFSTFLDEMRNVETVTGIAMDKDGNAYIVCNTKGHRNRRGGGFVAKFNPSGGQIYRTHLQNRGFSAPEGNAADA